MLTKQNWRDIIIKLSDERTKTPKTEKNNFKYLENWTMHYTKTLEDSVWVTSNELLRRQAEDEIKSVAKYSSNEYQDIMLHKKLIYKTC